MLVFNRLLDSVFKYPVQWAGLTRAIILCASAFGFKLSTEQIATLMLVVESFLTVLTHQQVSINTADKILLSKTDETIS
jgi:hypothetical protein